MSYIHKVDVLSQPNIFLSNKFFSTNRYNFFFMNHQEFSQVMSSSEYYFRIKQSNASTEISVLLYCVVIPFCIFIDLGPLVLSYHQE
jgi:hypothetical protein